MRWFVGFGLQCVSDKRSRFLRSLPNRFHVSDKCLGKFFVVSYSVGF